MRNRIVIALALVCGVVAAQEQGVVGVRARRNVEFRGRAFPMSVDQIGVVVGKRDLVLTPSLGQDPRNLRVFVPGAPEGLEAEVVDSDETFTVLRVDGLDADPVSFAEDWEPRVGLELHWTGVLAGAVGQWATVRGRSKVDAILTDEQTGTKLIYSDPPFRGPVTVMGGLVRDADGKAVGLVLLRTPPAAAGGGGRGGRGGGFRRAQAGLPVVHGAKSFAHYLSGEVVARGVLGVTGEALSDKVAEALGMKGKMGVLITQVTPGSGADAAGLQAQDVITKIDGAAVGNLAALQQALRGKSAGATVEVEFVRVTEKGPETHGAKATLQARESPDDAQRLRARRFGFVAELIPPAVRRDQGLDADVNGLHVRRITQGSPAALARPAPLRRGDIVMRVGDTPVGDIESLRKALEAVPNGVAVTLFVRRGGDTRFVEIRPEAADG